MILPDLSQLGHVLLDAVVAAPGVGEDVTVDAAGVGQQMPHRHLLGDVRIGQPQLGQHLGDGRVQIEHAFIDKLHSHASRSRPWR